MTRRDKFEYKMLAYRDLYDEICVPTFRTGFLRSRVKTDTENDHGVKDTETLREDRRRGDGSKISTQNRVEKLSEKRFVVRESLQKF